ncbi:methyltransferase domain-containing protein [Nocardioides sp. GY 10113]|uniref:methyltransferase domain-containing protein n=1 Tax=Nocardioides sp. GY 10113 TaxID=2569761 RepID=UPI0010A89877|nr:methyltransferase domain-containing protein [Nocardioides sp. GY 10113]TIC87382.1 methyltransferase domain-containing protein [Nocardioides sp. GY 10113]
MATEPGRRIHPEGFVRGHVPEDPEEELAGLVFALDAQAATPAVIRLREWTRHQLSPGPGDLALDVGSGTGSEVLALADLVGPGGRAVGVEPHQGLREVAEHRARAGRAKVEFVDGEAAELPFEDASVDVLRCERVFQHLADPAAAAAEFARVLKPGGRAAVLDSDWATAVAAPGDPELHQKRMRAMLSTTPNPFAGRHLRRQLRTAGLDVDPDIGSAALVPDDQLGAVMSELSIVRAVETGDLTDDEAERLRREFVSALERHEAFLSVTMFSVIGRKPR